MYNRLRKLTPILIIVLGFFTLGLSDLIWIHAISDEFNNRRFLPMKQVALTVVTLGIYGIFWVYLITSEMHKQLVFKDKYRIYLCVILSVLFLRTISIFVIHRAWNEHKTAVKDSD